MLPNENELQCIQFAKCFYHLEKISIFRKLSRIFIKSKPIEVSEIKKFSQLWSDYGLRDYGQEYWHRGSFDKEDKLNCIKYWVQILYDREIDVINMWSQIRSELDIQARNYIDNNPGVRIKMEKAENILPEKIDFIFGNYA